MTEDDAGPSTAALVVGRTECKTLRDDQFGVVRRAESLSDDFLVDNFDFNGLGSGGGKGGDVMARTRDGRFFVKTLNATDGKSLLEDTFLRAYVSRATTGQSLATKIYAVFVHPELGRFVVMNNCVSPRVESWSRLYDLKGTADDKTLVKDGVPVPHAHKRFYNLNLIVREWFSCYRDVPVPRQRYIAGKFEAFDVSLFMTKDQKEEIMTQLRNDCALFETHNLMDYSLLVGIQRVRREDVEEAVAMRDGDVHNKPYVVEYGGEILILYFGVIDFLQPWNAGKKVAHVIKRCFAPSPISTVNPKSYAMQFLDHFEFKFKSVGFEWLRNGAGQKRTPRKSPASKQVLRQDSSNAGAEESPSMLQRLRSSVANVTAFATEEPL